MDGNDDAPGTANSPSCTLTIDEGATVTALVAEGERIYYVENHARVMAVDADTGEGKVLVIAERARGRASARVRRCM
ncbi:MAG TPA: hypothetical protein PK156_51595, partial [Polyangium sp.]|nr:hypothetical protein [Polyangium sp.]